MTQTDAAVIRILIADDQELFAEGLRTILEARAPDIRVVGIARDGAQAVEMAARERPHIVLLDVRMPTMDGVEAVKRIHQQLPEVRVVMLTTFDDDEYVKLSLANGAIGYLLKNRPPAELIASIRAVRSGVLQIDPAVSKSLIRGVGERERDGDEFLRSLYTLTTRERDVLGLLVQAFDNRQIGARMGIAEQTVRNYVSTIYSKLGIVNRVEIMRYMDRIRFYLEHTQGPTALRPSVGRRAPRPLSPRTPGTAPRRCGRRTRARSRWRPGCGRQIRRSPRSRGRSPGRGSPGCASAGRTGRGSP